MKKTKIYIAYAVCVLMICWLFAACGASTDANNLWESAAYTEDTEFGNGAKRITVEVLAEDINVTFTINTDKETLGDALLEHSLIAGEKGPYGLYVKSVNGITADYEINKSYWSLTKRGECMQTGVDSTLVSDGEKYEFTYTK